MVKTQNSVSLEVVSSDVTVVDVRPVTQIAATPDSAPGKRFIPRTVEWDEEILVAPMRSPNMRAIPGEFGVFAKRDQTFLGRYAKKDNFVSNKTLLGLFEAALASMGLEFTRSVKTADYGAVMHATYTFPSITMAGPDGHRIALRVTLSNSYNGKSKVCAAIEALRLICLNGMIGFGQVFSISRRHSGLLDVPGIVASLSPQIESGADGLAAPMAKLIGAPIGQDTGAFILRNLCKANTLKFSGLMARRIETAWETPADDEKDSHATLWGLLNAGTRVFRDMEAEKVALVRRTAPFYTGALLGMTEKPDWFQRLTVPISRDEAYARDNRDE